MLCSAWMKRLALPGCRRETIGMTAVRGIRGAITVDCDSPEEIIARTSELLTRMMSENGVDEEDIIHIMFTSTPDIASAFPATAARLLGWVDTPLISAVEMEVVGSLDRASEFSTVQSSKSKRRFAIYLGRARELRPDPLTLAETAALPATGGVRLESPQAVWR